MKQRALYLLLLLTTVIAEQQEISETCPGPNERYWCGTECQPECATLEMPCKTTNKKCMLGCFCQEGYARNYKNICVLIASCPPICDKPNEMNSCGSACQTRCNNYGLPCPIINIVCNEKCYCKDGYARNGNNTAPCIPVEKCPWTPCPKNEHYLKCANICQRICTTLDQECTIDNAPRNCKDGACYCNDGYARNAKGVCILIKECPKPVDVKN